MTTRRGFLGALGALAGLLVVRPKLPTSSFEKPLPKVLPSEPWPPPGFAGQWTSGASSAIAFTRSFPVHTEPWVEDLRLSRPFEEEL